MEMRMLAVLSALLIPAGTSWAACSDDFSATALEMPWQFVDMDGVAGGSYALASGKLELRGHGGDIFKDSNEFVGIWRADIQGDFDISVKIESQTDTHGWAQAGILVATDISDLSKGGYVVLDISPDHGYNLFYDKAAPQGQLDTLRRSSLTAVTMVYPSWIRLAKSGTQFSAWYRKKADGPWTVLATNVGSLGTTANSQIALISLTHSQTKEGKAVFDDFTCLHTPTALRAPARSIKRPWLREGKSSHARNIAGRAVPGTGFFLVP